MPVNKSTTASSQVMPGPSFGWQTRFCPLLTMSRIKSDSHIIAPGESGEAIHPVPCQGANCMFFIPTPSEDGRLHGDGACNVTILAAAETNAAQDQIIQHEEQNIRIGVLIDAAKAVTNWQLAKLKPAVPGTPEPSLEELVKRLNKTLANLDGDAGEVEKKEVK